MDRFDVSVTIIAKLILKSTLICYSNVLMCTVHTWCKSVTTTTLNTSLTKLKRLKQNNKWILLK